MHLYRVLTASIAFTATVQTINLSGDAENNSRYLMTGDRDDSDVFSLAQTLNCSKEDGLCCPCLTPFEEEEKIREIVNKIDYEDAVEELAPLMDKANSDIQKEDTLKMEAGKAVIAKKQAEDAAGAATEAKKKAQADVKAAEEAKKKA